MTRPPHTQPRLVALVAAGGAVGTAARHVLAQALPSAGGWPTATFVANLVGAAALGVLLEALVRPGPESERARRLRLALGTGLLGGFTTFSSLAIEVERLLVDGRAGLGVAYGVVSVVLGFAVCFAGVAVAARAGRRRVAADAASGTADVRPGVGRDADGRG